MARKVTFTLDDQTVARIEQAAERLGLPKSGVVREAVFEYAERVGRLSERERERLLGLFDQLVPAIPAGPARAVTAELASVRAARRRGGRRSCPPTR
jgi:hypothetical protein